MGLLAAREGLVEIGTRNWAEAFNKFRTTRNWTEFDRALSERMMDTLVAFARAGNPATPATPWPQWKQDAQTCVEFGDVSGVREENRARLDFHTPANVTPSTPRISRD